MLLSVFILFLFLFAVMFLVRRLPTNYFFLRKKLGLILITRNHVDSIEGIVRGLCWLAASQQQEMEVVLIDNASTDGTYFVNQALARDYLHIHALESKEYQKSEVLVRSALELCPTEVVYYCQLPAGITRKELLPLFNRLFTFMDKEQMPVSLQIGLIKLQMIIAGLQSRRKVRL